MKLAIAALMIVPGMAFADEGTVESGAAVEAVAEAPATEAAAEETPVAPAIEPIPRLKSSTPSASTATASATVATPAADAKDWSVAASYNNAVGTAIFVANDAVRNSSAVWANSLSLKGGYKINDLLSLSASAAFSWEWTTPDSDNGRRWSFSDIKVGAASPKLYTEEITGITLSARAGFTLPTSIESLASSNVTNGSLGLGLSRDVGPVKLGYGFGFTKNFSLRNANVRTEEPTATNIPVDTTDAFLARHNFQVAQQAKICFRRDGESFCDAAGMNSNFSISNSLNASWTIVEGLSLSASFAVVNRWSYSPPVDQFSSTIVDSSGQRVVDNSGRTGDMTSGGLDLSYQINDLFAVSFGFATMGPALTADGKSLRFPFYDFVSPANNLTSWYLDLSASL